MRRIFEVLAALAHAGRPRKTHAPSIQPTKRGRARLARSDLRRFSHTQQTFAVSGVKSAAIRFSS